MRFHFLKFVLAITLISSVYSEEILVFLPGASKSTTTKELKKHSAHHFQVFKKASRFLKAVKKHPSAPIITSSPMVKFIQGYKPYLVGWNGSSFGQKWFIVATNPEVNLQNLTSKKVGVWDIMGRKNSKAFFESFFKLKIQKIKRVNNFKDLQPLLGMDMVDALAISEFDFNKLKLNTSVKLNVISTSIVPIEFAMIAYPTSGGAHGLKNFTQVSKSYLGIYGFDSWRLYQ